MDTNIIEVGILAEGKIKTRPVYQWDIGQTIKITDTEIADGTPVDFSNKFMPEGIRTYTLDNEVRIPEPALQQQYDLMCYLVVSGEDSETTVREIFIPVISKAKPEDYIGEEIEDTSEFKYIVQKANESEANANAAAASATSAETSADNANASQIAAQGHSEAAANSADAAAASAASAETSADNANAFANSAEEHSGAASASAEFAADSASEANSSAAASAQSANSAAASATQAASQAETAIQKAEEAADNATLSKSYAQGGTNSRTGEDTNNAKYYMERAALIVGEAGLGDMLKATYDPQSKNQDIFAYADTKAGGKITKVTTPTAGNIPKLTSDGQLEDSGVGLDDVGNADIITATNTSVPVSAWVTNTTYTDYPYRASIAIAGCTADYIPIVTFGADDAISGNFAPVAETYAGGVYIYAAAAAAITIKSIVLIKEAGQ